MSDLEQIEMEIRNLPQAEFAAFRQWFAGFDAEAWDAEFESDVQAGKLDELADRALRDHAAGRSTPL